MVSSHVQPGCPVYPFDYARYLNGFHLVFIGDVNRFHW